jgi:hypothetical protein
MDRIGPRPILTGGLTAIGVGLLLMTGIEPDSSFSGLIAPLALLGAGLGSVITAASEVIVGNAPVEDAGVAGGLQSTAVQVGGVMGTAILGSVLSSRVGSVLVEKLTGAGVPESVAGTLNGAKETVAQGVAPVVEGVSPQVQAAIVTGSHEAFMAGFQTSMVIGAVLAFLAAAGALFVQRGEKREGVVAVH